MNESCHQCFTMIQFDVIHLNQSGPLISVKLTKFVTILPELAAPLRNIAS